MMALGTQQTAGYSGSVRAWQQTAAGRTYFLYDGGVPVCELDSVGNVQAVATWGFNGLLARSTQASGVFTSVLYAFDGYGNTSHRLDASGNVLETLLCSAWGSLQIATINVTLYAALTTALQQAKVKYHIEEDVVGSASDTAFAI